MCGPLGFVVLGKPGLFVVLGPRSDGSGTCLGRILCQARSFESLRRQVGGSVRNHDVDGLGQVGPLRGSRGLHCNHVCSTGTKPSLCRSVILQVVLKFGDLRGQLECVSTGIPVLQPAFDRPAALFECELRSVGALPQVQLYQAHSDLDDVREVDVLLDHRRNQAIQVVELLRPEGPLHTVAAQTLLVLRHCRRPEDDRAVLGCGQLARRLNAERCSLQLGLVVAQEAALVDEELLAKTAFVETVDRNVVVVAPAPDDCKPDVFVAVGAALVLECDRAEVGGEHEPNHGLLALAGRHDLAGKVPEKERQDAQRRRLSDAVFS